MSQDIYAIVGARVREERKRAGFTIERLAELAGISPSFLSYVETGGRKASLATVQKLTEALGIPAAELFGPVSEQPMGPVYDATRQFAQLVRERGPKETEAILEAVKALSKALDRCRKARRP